MIIGGQKGSSAMLSLKVPRRPILDAICKSVSIPQVN
jgi:hypothetical protein